MQFVYFTVAAILLYLLSDRILVSIERWRGHVLPHRNLVFFAIILVLALTSFKLIALMLGTPA